MADTPELAALRARTMRREQALQRDAYRNLRGRHITDVLIGGLGVLLAAVAVASWLAGRA
jgi:hypothetical protein